MSLEHPKNLIAFQSQALGHLGQALDVDGILGPETEWALDFATLPARRQAIVRAAQEHLGLVEDPPRSNSDRAGFIRRWLLLCGAQPGDPEETEQAFELASGVASDVVTLVSAGVTPAGAVAAVRTVQDVARGIQELQSDGTVPMPLTAKDVATQQAQIASAARPLPPKPPPPKPPTPGRI